VIRRKPDGFSEVVRTWVGERVVILGGGPSLTQEQVDYVRDKARVIAINTAYQLAPWADVLYFADAKWFRAHRDGFRSFHGIKISNERSRDGIDDPAVHILRYRSRETFSDDPTTLTGGEHAHSGTQAINLAALAGSRDITLLGFDAREPRTGEKSHFFGEYPWSTPAGVYAQWRGSYRLLVGELDARGIRVRNASPGTAIEHFARVSLEDALASCDRMA